MKPFAEKFYKGTAWKHCRASFVKVRVAMDGGMCQHCGDRHGEIVHHVIWLTPENINNPDIALNHNNLEYVCWKCHENIKDPKKLNRRYTFGADGKLMPALPPSAD